MKTMKRMVFLSLSCSLALPQVAMADNSSNEINTTNLTHCEKQVLAQSTTFPALRATGKAAAYGTALAITAAAAASPLIISGISCGVAVSSNGTTSPIPHLVISFAASATVVALIYFGVEYSDYKTLVANADALSQLFKDVNNNGMGPQINIRMQAIKEVLSKISTFDKLTSDVARPKYSERTYDEQNIFDAIVKVTQAYTNSEVFDCSDVKALSDIIDKKTLKYLIEKYNPGMSVSESN